MRSDMSIIERLRKYQEKIYHTETYQGGTMILNKLKFECSKCKVHFTPSEYRAKNLMKDKGVINECERCEKGKDGMY